MTRRFLKRIGSLFILHIFLITIPALEYTLASSEVSRSPTSKFLSGEIHYRPADTISWSNLSDTTIALPDSGDIWLKKNSFLEIQSGPSVNLKLNEQTIIGYEIQQDTIDIHIGYGSIKTNVNPNESQLRSFTISAPNSIAGIRGTIFGVSLEESKLTKIFVEEGKVQLKSNAQNQVLEQDHYGRVKTDPKIGKSNVLIMRMVPDHLQLTWEHWNYQKNRTEKNRKLENLRVKQERIQDNLTDQSNKTQKSLKRRLRKTSKKIRKTKTSISNLEKEYSNTIQDYENYRKKISSERGNFTRKKYHRYNRKRKEAIENDRVQIRYRNARATRKFALTQKNKTTQETTHNTKSPINTSQNQKTVTDAEPEPSSTNTKNTSEESTSRQVSKNQEQLKDEQKGNQDKVMMYIILEAGFLFGFLFLFVWLKEVRTFLLISFLFMASSGFWVNESLPIFESLISTDVITWLNIIYVFIIYGIFQLGQFLPHNE